MNSPSVLAPDVDAEHTLAPSRARDDEKGLATARPDPLSSPAQEVAPDKHKKGLAAARLSPLSATAQDAWLRHAGRRVMDILYEAGLRKARRAALPQWVYGALSLVSQRSADHVTETVNVIIDAYRIPADAHDRERAAAWGIATIQAGWG